MGCKIPLNRAKLAARMLDYLDYSQVNVIGVSWGGALAHNPPQPCPPRRRGRERDTAASRDDGADGAPSPPFFLSLVPFR